MQFAEFPGLVIAMPHFGDASGANRHGQHGKERPIESFCIGTELPDLLRQLSLVRPARSDMKNRGCGTIYLALAESFEPGVALTSGGSLACLFSSVPMFSLHPARERDEIPARSNMPRVRAWTIMCLDGDTKQSARRPQEARSEISRWK